MSCRKNTLQFFFSFYKFISSLGKKIPSLAALALVLGTANCVCRQAKPDCPDPDH